jgi:hypothetical protein
MARERTALDDPASTDLPAWDLAALEQVKRPPPAQAEGSGNRVGSPDKVKLRWSRNTC